MCATAPNSRVAPTNATQLFKTRAACCGTIPYQLCALCTIERKGTGYSLLDTALNYVPDTAFSNKPTTAPNDIPVTGPATNLLLLFEVQLIFYKDTKDTALASIPYLTFFVSFLNPLFRISVPCNCLQNIVLCNDGNQHVYSGCQMLARC